MKLANLALCDTLLATLRDADLPMSTSELAVSAPWVREQVVHHSFYHHAEHPHLRLVTCAAGAFDVVDFRPRSNTIYVQLRALELAGLIVRQKMPGSRSAFWSFVAARASAEVLELEAMWSA